MNQDPVSLSEHGLKALHVLMASLFVLEGEEFRGHPIADMVFILTRENISDYIPDAMTNHRAIFNALLTCQKLEIIPDPEIVAGMVPEVKDIAKVIETILSTRTLPPDPNVSSAQFLHILQSERLKMAAQQVQKMVDMPPSKSLHQIATDAIRIIASADPLTYASETASLTEMADNFIETQEGRIRLMESAGVGSPPFPFAELNRTLGGLQMGEPMVLTALTGAGKSLHMLNFAWFWAKLFPFYVLFITHEQLYASIQARFYARELGIPSKYFKQPFDYDGKQYAPIQPSAAFWRPLFDVYQEGLKDHLGNLVIELMLEATPDMIVSKIHEHAQHARNMNKKMIVLDDYIQLWNIVNIKADRDDQRYGIAARRFKAALMATGSYGMVASQTTSDSQGVPKPKSAMSIKETMQGHIHFYASKRKITDGQEEPPQVIYDQDGEVMRDFFRKIRYWNNRDFGKKGRLRAFKANDSDTADAPVFCERPLQMIYDIGQTPRSYNLTMEDLIRLEKAETR